MNYLVVIVAALVSWFLGYLWYSPLLFGKKWMVLVGMDLNVKPEGGKRAMLFSFISAIVMAFVLSMVTISVKTAAEGIQAGFWIWLGFVATTTVNDFLYSVKPKPWTLYYINNGYYLASLVLMGIILSVWK